MFDLMERKIDEIRRQPEKIRFRYVLVMVAVVMVLVVFVWIFNLKESLKGSVVDDAQTIRQVLPERQPESSEARPSLEDTLDDEGVAGPRRE